MVPSYTTFINGGCSGGTVTINIKARLGRPCAIINMAAIPSTSTSVSVLTEDDIRGASLAGRKPNKLKNEELKFWLRCRDDAGKGLKTKAELVKRCEMTCLVRVVYIFLSFHSPFFDLRSSQQFFYFLGSSNTSKQGNIKI